MIKLFLYAFATFVIVTNFALFGSVMSAIWHCAVLAAYFIAGIVLGVWGAL